MTEQEIRELSDEIASLAHRVEVLDRELAPVTRLELDIKEGIRRTHDGRPGLDPISFRAAGASARRPMFDRLTEIAVKHGPVKAKRSELKARLRAYEKRVEVLTNEMEREKKRMAKAKTKPIKTKHEVMGQLLHNFGTGRIDRDRFWREMKANDFTQKDIDLWIAKDSEEARQGTILI